MDLNWDPRWGAAPAAEVKKRKRAVREVLPWVDLVHGNIRELNEFAGCAELEATLRRIIEWGARAVVIHMGGDGAGYFDGRELSVVPEREKLRLANGIVSEYIAGTRAPAAVL